MSGAVVFAAAACGGAPDSAETQVSVRTSALTIDDSNITMANPAAAPTRRSQLISFIWGTAGFPSTKLPTSRTLGVANPITSVPMTSLARVDHLIVGMSQGMQNELYHFIPAFPNGRLVIVHQGHTNVLDVIGVGETIAALVAEGYGVLGAFMPCNNSLGVGPGTGCPVTPQDPISPHNDMFAQIRPLSGHGSTYKYFVEHLAVGLNYLQTQATTDAFPVYNEFDMVGISGGGFTTTLYAAIDTRVRNSFSCSGSKPMYLRQCATLSASQNCLDGGGGVKYEGDREQMDASLFQLDGYLDLYALAAAGTGRRHVQIQIRHDGTVYGEDQYSNGPDGQPRPGLPSGLSWNQAVRAYEKKLAAFFTSGSDQGWYRYEIDETASGTHQISTNSRVATILSELDGDRRPFGAALATNLYTKGLTDTLFDNPPSWSNTGYGLVGVPSAVDAGTGSHVFLRDPSSQLMHLAGSQGGTFPTEEGFPGTIASDPAATLLGNRLDVVAVGTDSHLYHWLKIGAGAPTLEGVDGNTEVVGTPALLVSGNNRLDAFARSADGSIRHFFNTGSGWTTETVPNTNFRGLPAAVLAPNDSYLRLYGRGTDDALYEAAKLMPSGSWSLARLADHAGATGTKMGGSPGVTVDPSSGKPVVVTRAPNGSIDKFALSNAWSHLNVGIPMGSAGLTFAPVAVPGGLFTRSVEGHVWFDSFATNSWTSEGGQIY